MLPTGASLFHKHIFFFIVGEIPTTSRWMRDFVQNHSDYKQDSVVSDVINYDLLKQCEQKSEWCMMDSSKTTDIIPQALAKAEGYLNKKNPPTYENITPTYLQNGDTSE